MLVRNILVLIYLVSASAFVNVQRQYHSTVGIPLAKALKQIAEEETSSSEHTHISKTVGGTVADISSYPYFAGLLISLVNFIGTSVCGSSLISSDRLVTAAHCWYDGKHQAREYIVVMGTDYLLSGGVRIKTNKVVVHPHWNPEFLANDVAVVCLPRKIAFTDSIQPISLPSATDLQKSFIGEWATAIGFGKTKDEQTSVPGLVNDVTLLIVPDADCQRVFGAAFVRPSIICASGRGSVGPCKGDSGGPFMMKINGKPTLIGLSSFSAEQGCQLGFPTGFSRITSFLDFIIGNMLN